MDQLSPHLYRVKYQMPLLPYEIDSDTTTDTEYIRYEKTTEEAPVIRVTYTAGFGRPKLYEKAIILWTDRDSATVEWSPINEIIPGWDNEMINKPKIY